MFWHTHMDDSCINPKETTRYAVNYDVEVKSKSKIYFSAFHFIKHVRLSVFIFSHLTV